MFSTHHGWNWRWRISVYLRYYTLYYEKIGTNQSITLQREDMREYVTIFGDHRHIYIHVCSRNIFGGSVA